MDLTLRNIASLLQKSEKEILGFVRRKEIPFTVIDDRVLFNKQQIIEWALSGNVALNLSEHANMSEYHVGELSPVLDEGAFCYDCALTEGDYIEQMVERLRLENDVDRDIIVQLLKSREELLSTAIGNGISLPHPRIPLMVGEDKPVVAFFFPERPLDLKSFDGKPVHTLILLISQTIKQHLSLLAHLSFLLSHENFRLALEQRHCYADILGTIIEIESGRGN
ncbi:MAG: PTS sugar transporter subunit IIA [Bacteroidota bacterium]